MKEKGFTLIELLAVIVILAIIALIATPIILNIIKDAKEESQERSIELYASAAKNAIAKYQLNNTSSPTSFDQLDIEYDGNVECTTEELYSDGSIYLAGCSVNGYAVDYTYGTKQIVKGKLSSICTPADIQSFSTNPLEAGYKYECKVNPNKDPYTFYVLTTVASGATSVNLIMDSNINTSGEAVKSNDMADKGLVAWYTETNNSFGPITAMDHLQTATSTWTNLNAMTINKFNDDAGNTYEMAKTYTVYARMPYYSEVSNVSTTTLYLIDYLDGEYDEEDGVIGRNSVSGIKGYWTLTKGNEFYNAYLLIFFGAATDSFTDLNDTNYGVRPVITLDL